jgi:hypothetical protein
LLNDEQPTTSGSILDYADARHPRRTFVAAQFASFLGALLWLLGIPCILGGLPATLGAIVTCDFSALPAAIFVLVCGIGVCAIAFNLSGGLCPYARIASPDPTSQHPTSPQSIPSDR